MCQLLSRHDLLCAGDALASSADLLNQPINERMLEQLLAGEWQVGCEMNWRTCLVAVDRVCKQAAIVHHRN